MSRLDDFAGNDKGLALNPDSIKRFGNPPYPNGLLEQKATVTFCRTCNTSDLAQGVLLLMANCCAHILPIERETAQPLLKHDQAK